MQVLIVEDEQIIREGILSRPDWAGMGITQLRSAASAKEAFAVLENYTPDLIISDIRMRGMNGLEMCRKIREKLPQVQIIILTGYDEKEYLKEAIELGVVGFIEKPLSLTTLRHAIDKVRKNFAGTGQESGLQPSAKNDAAATAGENSSFSGPDGTDPPSRRQEKEERSSLAVKKVMSYIQDHYWEEDLSLKILAEQVYLTPQYLSTLFKNETGMTVGQYMADHRIDQAKRMLDDPSYKLYQISGLVGYKDANYFTRLFRKKTGMTPMEYRNRNEQTQ